MGRPRGITGKGRARKPQRQQSGVVIAYCRVSTAEQAESEAGMKAQRAKLEAWLERREYQPGQIVWREDPAVSAKNLKRKAWQEVHQMLADGRADVLVVDKLDRLTRSIRDFGNLLADAKAEGWQIVVLDPELDMTSPMGEGMASMLVVFAQWERRLIGQRTKDALAQKKKDGVKLGPPPARKIPQQTRELILELHAKGRSLQGICDHLEAMKLRTPGGKRTWSTSSINNIVVMTRQAKEKEARQAQEAKARQSA